MNEQRDSSGLQPGAEAGDSGTVHGARDAWGPEPAAWTRSVTPYAPPSSSVSLASAPAQHGAALKLDSNEGPRPPARVMELLATLDERTLRHYSKPAALEANIAGWLSSEWRRDVLPAQVIVTAGGDDALDRLCRVCLEEGRVGVTTHPSFEMIPRYIAKCGGIERSVAWFGGPFPTARIIQEARKKAGTEVGTEADTQARDQARERKHHRGGNESDEQGPGASLVFVVSPNNPTGGVASLEDVRTLARELPRTLIVVDAAYGEFAEVDLSPLAGSLANVVAVRTFSKAWGLAGLRVGYVVGDARWIGLLRAAGNPYAVASPSLALAGAWLDEGREAMGHVVRRVAAERAELAALLASLGGTPLPSEGNFVLADFGERGAALRVWQVLVSRGIAVRRFEGGVLASCLRVTCPGDGNDWKVLADALQSIAAQEPRASERV
ncbi:MAG: histidinol-phosphate transaminase [Planctomycetota bacterium]|nr:histidinol-phosphate transaminase [Planctomycetota bacterium]